MKKQVGLAMAFALASCSPTQTSQTGELKADLEKQGQSASLQSTGIDPDSFVEGNLYFLAYHELGHALVSEFQLPIAGREEDAVDRIAIRMMTPVEQDEPAEYLEAAMQGWFTQAELTPLNEIQWWDEHGTEQQRGFQIACLLYGTNPQQFADIADKADLPKERRESCEYEAVQNEDSWQKLLGPYEYREDAQGSKATIHVVYGKTNDFADELSYLKELGLLEHLADLMVTGYRFEPGIQIGAEECGESNSYWYPEERKLIICYELVDEYRTIAGK
jgi:hypothetical protein